RNVNLKRLLFCRIRKIAFVVRSVVTAVFSWRFIMGLQAVLFTLCVTVVACASDINFLDCKVKENSWSYWRNCCKSAKLPNGCECYDIWSSDFTNSFYNLPLCPKNLKVSFLFFDRDHRENATVLQSKTELSDLPFSGTKRSVFVTHGFNDRGGGNWTLTIKDALLETEDLNVVLVDWGYAANSVNYLKPVANTRSVGAMVAKLILDLNQHTGAPFTNFHLVGHSLGAHVCGIAGEEIKRLTGQKLGRITGLDPAGPSFESYSTKVRLDSSDAEFVEAIHTDSEPLYSSGFGIRISCGHVDFWPNGGEHQPGCPEETWGILGMLNFEADFSSGACSHSRAISLFTDSITLCRYDPQGPCTMGYHTAETCRGNYYPDTLSAEPFC
ncbi:hypothetical protein EGW08_013191, partial [Elysia chlorotica]